MVLYGPPGMAKSTTGLSAPGVLFLDCDKGWKRIPAQFKNASRIEPSTYQEILDDLTPDTVAPFETIVIDTGGALLNFMKAWSIRQNPVNGQKDGVTLSIKGYGAVGAEFERLTQYVFNTLQKNLVVIFHSREEMDGESKVYRLDVEGQTKNNIFKCMDLAGFMEMRGDRIFIGFSPTERYYAKGTGGISGQIELPNVMKGAKNNFLTELFNKLSQNVQDEAAMAKQYDVLMETVKTLVSSVTDASTALQALVGINDLSHVFASEREAKVMLNAKTTAVGLAYNKATNVFEEAKK